MSELLDKSRSLRSCRKRGAKVKQLPESQQNAIAAMILEELEDEARCWDNSFNKSPDLLAKLATKALEEDKAGNTKELELNKY